MFVALPGCSMGNTNVQRRAYTVNDIERFVTIGTKIVLKEGKVPKEQVFVIQRYIVALQNYVDNTDAIDFTVLRKLIDEKLPQQYQFIGGSIIDIIYRFVNTELRELRENNEVVIKYVSAGLRGAMSATEEYVNSL